MDKKSPFVPQTTLRGLLVIVQGQERDEALILRAQPTGFLQGTPVLQQIVTDCSLVRVQTTAVVVERKVVEVPPIIRTQREVVTGLRKLFEQSFRFLIHCSQAAR